MILMAMTLALEGWLVVKLGMVGALGMMQWWWWTIGKGFEWLLRRHLLLRCMPSEDAQGILASWTETFGFACCYAINDHVVGDATLVTSGVINGVIVAPDATCTHARTCMLLQSFWFNATTSETGAGL